MRGPAAYAGPLPRRMVSAYNIPMGKRKLPIGIQDFHRLREEGYIYIDKTELLYRLVQEGSVYFLSRPRRFGKSLTCSTLGAYLEGRRELFAGLALERLETEWTEYPVLRLDLNAGIYNSVEGLIGIIEDHLAGWEDKYGKPVGTTIPGRFSGIIEKAHVQTGKRTCVIIDEYDKPLLSTIGNPELHEKYKQFLKPFFGVLKSSDAHLKFAFITGVTKFGPAAGSSSTQSVRPDQVSVFSDLNQLIDLSMDSEYAALCGITEEELLDGFRPEIDALAEKEGVSYDKCVERIRKWYNGYRFHPDGPAVYNPFSTLNLFRSREFQDFWFQTGTPTFLVELLKKTDTDLREIDGIELPASAFADYRADPDRPVPVIYQSGYLTVKSYNKRHFLYTLGYPNREVERGFLFFVLPYYSPVSRDKSGFHISRFAEELEAGDVDAFMERLKCFFESIPYDLNDQTERHYHVVFYLVFKLLGQYIDSEVKSSKGRSDAVVSTPDYLYVFEFKLNGTAEEALAQIDDKGYLIPYSAKTDGGRTLRKIGVEFDKKARNIGRWITDGK